MKKQITQACENISIAVTGHRPNKLWGYDLTNEKYNHLQKLFEQYVINKFSEGTQEVQMISGMALGTDMVFAEAALSLKRKGYNVKLVAAIPFAGQEKLWSEEYKTYYRHILDQSDDVVFVCKEGYAPWKMQKRNEYMVDRCDVLVAVWDGSKSGTENCVNYAAKRQKEILVIFPSTI